MEKAYLCPTCQAEIFLDGEGISACCFCGSALQEAIPNVNSTSGSFYLGDVQRAMRETAICRKCNCEMILPSSEKEKPRYCLNCGGSELSFEKKEVLIPEEEKMLPFSVTKEEAKSLLQTSIRKDQKILGGYASKANLEAITPAYLPCFFFDYHVYADASMSIVPYVKEVRENTIGSRIFSALVMNEINFNLERTSNVAQPYDKHVGGEMAWQDIPLGASRAVSRERFFQMSPFSIKGIGKNRSSEEKQVGEQAVLLQTNRSPRDILDTFHQLIRDFVKECLVTTNLNNFKITSFVDNTNHPSPVGRLVYVPIWCLKISKKDRYFSWYVNAVNGQPSRAGTENIYEIPLSQQENSLEAISKKRIKKFTMEDFQSADRSFNYRTYMVDEMASAIAAEMELNEMAADKTLLHLERTTRRNMKEIKVPIVSYGYQAEAEEEVKRAKMEPLPSSPVELPSTHSYLYTMKEESMKRSLGRGQRLPEKPMDRRVGNEHEFDNQDNSHEYIAKELGLADIPEYDPNGPNPFKK